SYCVRLWKYNSALARSPVLGADRTLRAREESSLWSGGILVGTGVSRQEAGEDRRPGMETNARLRLRIEMIAEQLQEEFGELELGEHGCLMEAVEEWAVPMGDQLGR